MRARSLVASFAIASFATLGAAHADPKSDVQAKLKQAMESYDMMDYDAARKILNQALATAKKAKLDKDPIVAKAYIDLGIVSFANSDQDSAKLSFLSAVQIDPKIQIDPAYKSADMAKLLESARAEAKGSGGGGEPAGGGSEPVLDTTPAAECSSVKGLEHALIDTAAGGKPLAVEAKLGADVKATKVVVMFRPEGATEFTEVKLAKNGCTYTGQIPAAALHGGNLHYYVAAYDSGVKPIASKGSAGSPNIIEITGGGAAPKGGDDEDPIGGAKVKAPPTGGGGGGGEEVSSSVTVGPKRTRFMIAVSGGMGGGYVTGTTEGGNMVKNCCVGGPGAVVMPELGYYINPKLTIGAAARIGFPLGANVDGHATAAPGGLLRLRYALGADGYGLRVMGQLGYGVIRNTIKLDNSSMPGMDTDVVAQGPVLVGGGVGYAKKLGGSLAFIADLSALAGIGGGKNGLSPVLNSGLSADLSLGLAVGF